MLKPSNDMPARKIGLALGGGSVFGYTHIGVLRAIDEFQIPISCIAGTSVGSLIGSLYAFGKSWQELQELAEDAGWLNISGVSLTKYGVLSNKKLGNLLNHTLGKKHIEESPVPLAIMATDISNGEKVTLRKGNLDRSIMASTCVPGIFNPVEIDGRLLVDGGVIENVPLSPLFDMGANYIISVDLTSHYRARKPKNVAEVLVNAFHSMHTAVARVQEEKVDLAIKPNLSKFSIVDIKQKDKLIELGYREAKRALKESELVSTSKF